MTRQGEGRKRGPEESGGVLNRARIGDRRQRRLWGFGSEIERPGGGFPAGKKGDKRGERGILRGECQGGFGEEEVEMVSSATVVPEEENGLEKKHMTSRPGLAERKRGKKKSCGRGFPWAAAGLSFPGRPSWAGFHFFSDSFFIFCFVP
jgi:hypothetical protein